jgi:hypothetical protein
MHRILKSGIFSVRRKDLAPLWFAAGKGKSQVNTKQTQTVTLVLNQVITSTNHLSLHAAKIYQQLSKLQRSKSDTFTDT